MEFLGNLEGRPSLVELSNSTAIREYRVESQENNTPIAIYWWEIANFQSPEYFRVALFSYTVAVSEEYNRPASAELDILKDEIPKTNFGPLQDWETDAA